MNNFQLRELIIRPTLIELEMYSQAAEDLVAGTIAHESQMGQFIKQFPTGPALGIIQMETATHNSLWKHFIRYRDTISNALWDMTITREAEEMVWNLKYAVAMCRVHYYSKPGSIPTDVEGLAAYWKQHYNTSQGKGTEEQFIKDYKRYAQ